MKKILLFVLFAVFFAAGYAGENPVLSSGKLKVVLRQNGTAPREIYYDGSRIIRNYFYSWYARGNWYSDRNGVSNNTERPGGVSGINILSQKSDELKINYNCTDFNVTASYFLLHDPDAVKVEFYLKARKDICIGGMDPPGGFSLPLISRDPRFTHFYKVGNDLSLKLLSKKDYPRTYVGTAQDSFAGAVTTADGKEGYFTLIDRRFYGEEQPPFVAAGGICYSKDVCRLIKAGEVLKGQFYLVPFKDNAAAVIKAAAARFCDPDPAKRWDRLASYRNVVKQALKTFSVVAENDSLIVASGSTEHVFPQSPLPVNKVPAIRLESAGNMPVFSQIVLKAKCDLKALSFKLEFPTLKEAVINRITPAPSEYPVTAFGTAGDYPDILQMPEMSELTGTSGNQPFLLTLMVPANAAAGIHKGSITLFSGKKELVKVPVEVLVHDFALPVRSSFRTAFLAWTSAAYKDRFNSLDYIRDQRKLRITTPVEISTPCDKEGNIRNPEHLRRAVKAVMAAGDTCFRLGSAYMWRGMPFKDKCGKEAEIFIKNFARQVYAILKELNAEKDVWLLIADETHRDDLNKKHVLWSKWVKEAAPELPIFSTQNHPVFAIADNVDILCGPYSSIQVLQKKYGQSKEYWIYENGFPFGLGQTEMVQRTMPLRCRRGNVAGYHQWSSCFWTPELDTNKFRPGCFHGTASLYYPPEYGYTRGRPVRSMRLINCSQGIIDFDCVTMLENLIAAKPELPESKEADAYLDKELQKLVPDIYTVSGSTAEFDAFRKGVFSRIAKLLKK